MSKKIGIDVSKWQGRMDWAKAKSAGANYCIIRAGSVDSVTGRPYKDFQFDKNSQEAPQVMPSGFYWYFRPNYDVNLQADYFTNLIAALPWKESPTADIEESAGLSSLVLAERILRFLKRLENNGLGVPDIYTRSSIWNISVGSRPEWANYKLHIARYVNIDANDMPLISGPWADGKFKPRDWNTWKRWQFSADGNNKGPKYGAESMSIDLNLQEMDDIIVTPSPTPIEIELRIPLGIKVKIVEV